MTSLPRPCVVCGTPARGSRCREHKIKDTRPTLAKRESRSVSTRLRRRCLSRDGYTCRACGALDRTGRSLEADHIVPLDLDGQHVLENLQTLCIGCHAEKTAAEAKARRARK